jgi:hypothetical protein
MPTATGKRALPGDGRRPVKTDDLQEEYATGRPGGHDKPLSADLKSGQSAMLAELAILRGEAGAQMRRAESGPALALKAYLEKPNDQRLERLTKAVLKTLDKDTVGWEAYSAAVKALAEDPTNHPLDCECEACL